MNHILMHIRLLFSVASTGFFLFGLLPISNALANDQERNLLSQTRRCESIENALAYNECLAEYGPIARQFQNKTRKALHPKPGPKR